MIYNWCFRVPADEWGVFVTFVFALCAAARLARFNIADTNLKSFTGLPTPGAAGVVAAVVYATPSIEPGVLATTFGTTMLFFLSYLMVSTVEFFSLKKVNLARLHPLAFILVGALIALIWYSARIGFVVLAVGYCASGPLRPFVVRRKKAEETREVAA